jgi:hypothetical protein
MQAFTVKEGCTHDLPYGDTLDSCSFATTVASSASTEGLRERRSKTTSRYRFIIDIM